MGFTLHMAEMGMGPLPAPGREGGEMGLFPPKCLGGERQEPATPKPSTGRWRGGTSARTGAPEIGSVVGECRKRDAVYFQCPKSVPCSGNGNDRSRRTIPGSCSCHCPVPRVGAEQGCSPHLLLPPRTSKATLVLFPLLSEGTELPQLS